MKKTIEEQLAAISWAGIKRKPKPKVKKPKVIKEKKSRKSPCTKVEFDRAIKHLAKCCASCIQDMRMDNNNDTELEDIICDSVDSLLAFNERRKDGSEIDLVWYWCKDNNLKRDFAKDAIYDIVYSEASKLLKKEGVCV